MGYRRIYIQCGAILLVVWLTVWGVRSYAATRQITAERVNQEIARARFEDWSTLESIPSGADAKKRDINLRNIAAMVNRLDFQEREKNRANRTGEEFFRKLTNAEKTKFIELTIVESMSRFMESLDAMKPDDRKKFVEQGLKAIREGQTEAEMARADKLGADLLDRISQEGMKAYFEKSSADTKLDLAPLMEAMNETMQGLRGNEFGPRQ